MRPTVSCVFWVLRVLPPAVPIFLGPVQLVQLVQSKSINITVDDASGQVHFSNSAVDEGNWSHTNEAVWCYNNTESVVFAVSASASLQFEGTGIYVLGSDFEFARPFLVTLDGEKMGPFVGTNPANELNLVPIWSVTNLTQDAPHLIVVLTWEPANPIKDESYTFSLDGFIVTQELPVDASTTTSAAETSSSSPLTLVSSSTVPDILSTPQNKNLGAIAGVVVGGMVGAVLAMLALSQCRRRRVRKREKKSLDMMTETELPIGGIIPFMPFEHDLNPYVGDPTQQALLSSTRPEPGTVAHKSQRKVILALPNGVRLEAHGPAEELALPLLGAATQPHDLQETNEPNTEHAVATGRSQNGDSFPDAVPPPDYETLSAAHSTHDDANRPVLL